MTLAAENQDLYIRLAAPSEVAVVHRLTREGFADYRRFANPSSALTESAADVERAMARGGAVLAFRNDEPIAVARFEVHAADAVLVFSRMVVVPKERGLGVGQQLVAWLEEHAGALGLSVVEITVRSQQPDNRGYYERLGYRITGYSERYGIPDMVTHMRKDLRG